MKKPWPILGIGGFVILYTSVELGVGAGAESLIATVVLLLIMWLLRDGAAVRVAQPSAPAPATEATPPVAATAAPAAPQSVPVPVPVATAAPAPPIPVIAPVIAPPIPIVRETAPPQPPSVAVTTAPLHSTAIVMAAPPPPTVADAAASAPPAAEDQVVDVVYVEVHTRTPATPAPAPEHPPTLVLSLPRRPPPRPAQESSPLPDLVEVPQPEKE